ncbi:MAG: DUF1405 domain-containing protein [Anaerolineae bacterium]|nr:DUF1405 domain-containing protein [Anaerolineae bacterium]
MRLYNQLERLVLLRPVAITIIAIGLIGGVWGFIDWYGPTFARYPVWQWPFVPDCPLFALLFTLSLGLLLIGRNWAPYNAIVAFGLIKYGVWTVTVWILFWANGGPLTTESVVMTLAHTGMVLEGLFLLRYLKLDWPTLAASAIWFGLSDWMDYGPFETYPHFPSIIPYAIVRGHTIAMTVLLTALYGAMAWRRRRSPAAAGQ